MSHRDMFHSLKVAASALDYEQLTATKADAPVFDFRDHRPGQIVGFLVTVHAAATADASNYFEFELWEADEKASGTALTSGTKVADGDLLGYTADGVRSRTVNPAYDATLPSVTQTEKQYLQDGYVPKLDATADAGKVFFFAYRGYKKCLQIRPTETGTADVTVSAVTIVMSGESVNLVNPATFA